MDTSPSKSTSTDSEVSEDSFFGLEGLSMGKIVSIEGNIGGGKTTLLSHMKLALKDNKNVIFLKEPVDDWETIKDKEGCTMLQKFYGDQAKYSFPFQMMAFISRLVLLRNAAKENPHAILVTERSLYVSVFYFFE
jgi:deoxyadenosine/deoxycytidine kinase